MSAKEFFQENKLTIICAGVELFTAITTIGSLSYLSNYISNQQIINSHQPYGDQSFANKFPKKWIDNYWDKTFTKEQIMKDPTALMMVGAEALDSGAINVDQANNYIFGTVIGINGGD